MARGFLPFGLVVTVAAVMWLAYVSIRKPYLRHMAGRHFIRRPSETALIVVGSILGTALITGSFITSDSLTSSFTSEVYDTLGEVDEQVQLTSDVSLRRAESRLDEIRHLDHVDGVALVETATGTTRSATNTGLASPATSVYALDVAQLDDFGQTKQSVGGPALTGDEAIVTEDLAEQLDLKPGDSIELLIYDTEETYRVVRVATGTGFAKFNGGSNLFLPKGALWKLAASGRAPVPPTVQLWVSNSGGPADSADWTFVVDSEIQRLLGSDLEIFDLKRVAVDVAQRAADSISQLFLVIGTFAVISGILLLVNIFVMLAAERKPEMGMMRSVGMRRSDLVRGFTLEGAFYGGTAAVLGTVVGIGVGMAIIRIASSIFEQAETIGRAMSIQLVLRPGTLVSGMLVGFAISFLTILLTSMRISRINIIAAIRDIEVTRTSGPGAKALIAGAIAVLVGVVMAVPGIATQEPMTSLVGPALCGIGLYPLGVRFIPKRLLASLISGAILAWAIVIPLVLSNLLRDSDSPFVFVMHGMITTFAAVVLLSQNQEALSRVVRALAKGSPRRGLAARLATTYPVAKRFRTAMTMIMYALIVFTLVMITSIGHVNQLNTTTFVRTESSGFDILARTNPATPAAERDIEAVPGVEAAFGIETAAAKLEENDNSTETLTDVFGVDEALLQAFSLSVTEWDESYGSGSDVLRAVTDDGSLVILDRTMKAGAQGGPPGEFEASLGQMIEMTDPVSGKTIERRVVGFGRSMLTFKGALIQRRALVQQFATAGLSIWLVKTVSSSGVKTTADTLEAANTRIGLRAESLRRMVDEVLSLNEQFFGLLQGYLALGLIVGIVGLGVVMIRSVRERRRAIGILRALGFAASTVRRAFMAEAGLVAFEGIAVGVVLGIITARNLLTSSIASDFDVPFAVPWLSIIALGVTALGFSLVVAFLPARAASKIRPAVALRIAD